jgi:hypothetical protein
MLAMSEDIYYSLSASINVLTGQSFRVDELFPFHISKNEFHRKKYPDIQPSRYL